MAFDFSALTVLQQELLTFGGWTVGSPNRQPGERAVRKLLDRGLLLGHEYREPTRIGFMSTREYEVPLAVHMAWCDHCSRKRRDEA